MRPDEIEAHVQARVRAETGQVLRELIILRGRLELTHNALYSEQQRLAEILNAPWYLRLWHAITDYEGVR